MPALESLRTALRSLGIAMGRGFGSAGRRIGAASTHGIRAARRRYDSLRAVWWVAGPIALGATLFGVIANWEPVSGALCQLNGIHEICRQRGWGGLATPDQEERYQAAVRNDCPGIRQYLRTESPSSPLFPLAQQRWDTRMRRVMREEPLDRGATVVATSDIRPSRAEAVAQLIEATRAQATEECSLYARIPGYSLQSLNVALGAASCESLGTGWTCSAESRAQCRIRWRREIDVERC